MSLFKRLIVEESGQGITEYALILGLLVLGVWVVVSYSDLPARITNLFTRVGKTIDLCVSGSCGK